MLIEQRWAERMGRAESKQVLWGPQVVCLHGLADAAPGDVDCQLAD